MKKALGLFLLFVINLFSQAVNISKIIEKDSVTIGERINVTFKVNAEEKHYDVVKWEDKFSADVEIGPKDIAVTSIDEKFLKRAIEIIENNLGDCEFDVSTMTEEMGMSRMQLFRKLKALTDQNPSEFIRTIRLKRAAQLIKKKFGNVAEITYEVGFNNLSYFAKCFKELYGISPSEFAKA